jgi:hypothetical protein
VGQRAGRPGARGKSPAASRRLSWLGNAAHLLGIKPDDWARFTVEETDVLLDWLDQYAQQIKEQEAELKG